MWGNLAMCAKEDTMEHQELEYFRNLLSAMLEEAQQKGDSTLEELTDSNEVFADPADRATAESDRSFTLRIRDRERRLIRKIQAGLQRIDDGSYGMCEECGEEIGVPRLKARPVTKLCINCKSKQEEDEHLRND
jgi:DnaK suppressor protein